MSPKDTVDGSDVQHEKPIHLKQARAAQAATLRLVGVEEINKQSSTLHTRSMPQSQLSKQLEQRALRHRTALIRKWLKLACQTLKFRAVSLAMAASQKPSICTYIFLGRFQSLPPRRRFHKRERTATVISNGRRKPEHK
jgi:hypothetical protein